MAAIRTVTRIIIRMEFGVPIDIEARTLVTATEDQLKAEGPKVYSTDYATLGAGAKARVDSFVADVEAFIQAQEPIV